MVVSHALGSVQVMTPPGFNTSPRQSPQEPFPGLFGLGTKEDGLHLSPIVRGGEPEPRVALQRWEKQRPEQERGTVGLLLSLLFVGYGHAWVPVELLLLLLAAFSPHVIATCLYRIFTDPNKASGTGAVGESIGACEQSMASMVRSGSVVSRL